MDAILERWKVINVVETILLVDGDTATRHALKFILELHGYRIVEALNGIEALQVLGEWGADIQVALCTEDLADMTTGQWRGQLRFLAPEIPSLILSDRERLEIGDLQLGAYSGEEPIKLPTHIRLLERLRIALDERFFANRARATAA